MLRRPSLWVGMMGPRGSPGVPRFYTASELRAIIKAKGHGALEELLYLHSQDIGDGGIYLSLDMDGLDPAYAPGVGTPEPFGLSDLDVKVIVDHLAPRLVGFDLVEVCPPFDNGNTAALAARFIRDVVGLVWKAKKQ